MFNQTPEFNCRITFGQYFYIGSGIKLVAWWDLRLAKCKASAVLPHAASVHAALTSPTFVRAIRFRYEHWAVADLRCMLAAFG